MARRWWWIPVLVLGACSGAQRGGEEAPRDASGYAAEGRRYLFGEGVTRDRGKARDAFQAACAGGDREACTILAVTFGEEPPRSLIDACLGGNEVSCLVFRDAPPKYDVTSEEGKARAQGDCERGFGYACAGLVYMGPRDPAEHALLEKACRLGDAEACASMTTAGEQPGMFLETDEDKAWHGKGVMLRMDYCAKGSAVDCMQLGLWYETGAQGLEKDRRRSEEYRRRGIDIYLPICRRGHVAACAAIARASTVDAEKKEAARFACFMDPSWCER
jgi:TPR repeat protein